MLNMTIEKNKKDKEAHKLLCQLYYKIGDMTAYSDTLDEMKDNTGLSGDYYYLLAVLKKEEGNKEEYISSLKHALELKDTLTFDKKAIMGEIKNAG